MSKCLKTSSRCVYRFCLLRSARRDWQYAGRMFQRDWCTAFPRTWFLAAFNAGLLILRSFSPSLAVKWALWPTETQESKRCRRGWIDLYVLISVGFLLLGLLLKLDGWWLVIPIGLMVEMMIVTLGVRFVDPMIEGPANVSSPNRSIVLLLVGYFELVVGFAHLYMVMAGADEAISAPLEALYFSFVTITTLGYSGEGTSDGLSKLFVCVQIASGLILIALMLAAFLGLQQDTVAVRRKRIARRAFEMYVAEGRPEGSATQHWLAAQRELYGGWRADD